LLHPGSRGTSHSAVVREHPTSEQVVAEAVGAVAGLVVQPTLPASLAADAFMMLARALADHADHATTAVTAMKALRALLTTNVDACNELALQQVWRLGPRRP
jgi:hypothetical protein